jgi:chondroitin-sulfate-ABC endolyase/exolyase
MKLGTVVAGSAVFWAAAMSAVAGQSKFESFENGLPSYANVSRPSGIRVSPYHYKNGKKSLRWDFKSGDYIRFKHGIGNIRRTGGYGGTYGKATFGVWVYCDKPLKGALKFDFCKGSQVTGWFEFPLNFKGWQRADLRYSWRPQFRGKVSPDTDNIVIHAPKDISGGTCFIDLMVYNRIVDFRQQYVPEAKKWKPVKINSREYPLPSSVDTAEKAGIQKVRKDFLPEVSGAVTPNAISAIERKFKDLRIVKDEHGIRGIPIIFPADGYNDEGVTGFITPKPVGELMLAIGSEYLKNGSDADKKKLVDWFILMTEHLADQGFRAGAGCKWNWYNGRDMAQAVFIMGDALRKVGKIRVPAEYLEYNYDTGLIYEPEKINPSMDFFHIDTRYLLYGALMQANDKEIIRALKAFSSFISKAILFEGYSGFKPDGCAYHHNFNYFAYSSYSTNSLSYVVKALSRTPFAISPDAWALIKKVLLNMRFYANKKEIPFTIEGRHPFRKQKVIPAAFLRIAESAPDGKVDKELAAAALRLDSSLKVSGVEAEKSPEGNMALNYGGMSVHRRGNTMALAKGFSRNITHGETYSRNNRFGRFLSHGSLIIQREGQVESGYVEDGFDWTAIDGATTVHHPLKRYKSSRGTEMFRNNVGFMGGLSHCGWNGIFVAPVSGPEGRNPDLRAQKSFFFFDKLIVCLGTGIFNKDKYDMTRTTLFQKYLKSKSMPMWVNGREISAFPVNPTALSSKASWLIDPYGTGYYVFPGQKVYYDRKHQQSRDQQDKKDTAGDFASAWIEHGLNPQGETYRYAVMMDAVPAEMNKLAAKLTFSVVRQDQLAHVVAWGDHWGAVFFTGMKNIKSPLVDAVQRACLVMSEKQGDGYCLSVSDPDLNLYKSGAHGLKSKVTPLAVMLHGNWKLADNAGGVKVIARNDGNTLLRIACQNGFSYSVKLQPASGSAGKIEKSAFAKCVDYNSRVSSAVLKKVMNKLYNAGKRSDKLADVLGAVNMANVNNVKADCHQEQVKRLFDQNVQTNWRGYYTASSKAVFVVDLGQESEFNAVTVHAGNLKSGIVLNSNNGKDWQQLGELKKISSGTYGLVKAAKASYIKIDMTGPANKKVPVIVSELSVVNAKPGNHALLAAVKAKHRGSVNWRYPYTFAFDGDGETSFGTYSAWKGSEFILDLGMPKSFSKAMILNSGGVALVTVAVSDDGKGWKLIGKYSGKPLKKVPVNFKRVKARFVRIDISGKGGTRINEIELK